MAKPKKRKPGRPPFEFDMRLVERLARIQCTDEEIAAACGCSRSTVADRKRADPEFSDTIEKGRLNGKTSLRRLQWKAAHAGNTAVLIFLGKNMLGQTDRVVNRIEDPDSYLAKVLGVQAEELPE